MQFEESHCLLGSNRNLVTTITKPIGIESTIGLVLLNAGMVYRIGPNRLYVKMARELAKQGVTTARFDFSGIGDSESIEKATFKESSVKDIHEVVNYLKEKLSLEHIYLSGVCSGANLAFEQVLKQGYHLSGLILINGEFVDESVSNEYSLEIFKSVRARYYKKKLWDIGRWLRLVSFKSKIISLTNIVLLIRGARDKVIDIGKKSSSTHKIIEPFNRWKHIVATGKPILLIYSEGSTEYDFYKIFHEKKLRSIKNKPNISVHFFKDMDHVFSSVASQNILIVFIKNWINDQSKLSNESCVGLERADS